MTSILTPRALAALAAVDFRQQVLGVPPELVEPGTWVYVNTKNYTQRTLGGELLRYEDGGAVVRYGRGREFWTNRGLSLKPFG